MKRKAFLYRKSEDGKRALYLDEQTAEDLFAFLKADRRRRKKFDDRLRYILAGQTTRDIYAQENIEKGCEQVYAIKMFKGGQNARIYCQQFYHGDTEVLVIVAAELLPKKKSQKLTHKEKTIIRRVAGFTYQLTDDE
ncbi:MAG: hypothetical protein RI842_07695 [Schleiferiaceae bacterium]|jgi:hypothetical protein|nr:hypothetical protein [Schleiferiaceae bacterium]MDR9442589.1 hypothetical protein [Schleiferiaceae bacterium]